MENISSFRRTAKKLWLCRGFPQTQTFPQQSFFLISLTGPSFIRVPERVVTIETATHSNRHVNINLCQSCCYRERDSSIKQRCGVISQKANDENTHKWLIRVRCSGISHRPEPTWWKRNFLLLQWNFSEVLSSVARISSSFPPLHPLCGVHWPCRRRKHLCWFNLVGFAVVGRRSHTLVLRVYFTAFARLLW